MKVEIRNDAIGATAFVAPSRTKHLGAGWYVVGTPDAPPVPEPVPLRPGIEAENPDEPQGSVTPATPDTPEEK